MWTCHNKIVMPTCEADAREMKVCRHSSRNERFASARRRTFHLGVDIVRDEIYKLILRVREMRDSGEEWNKDREAEDRKIHKSARFQVLKTRTRPCRKFKKTVIVSSVSRNNRRAFCVNNALCASEINRNIRLRGVI